MNRLSVIGIEVADPLLARWGDWLAPEVQPFFVESLRSWPKGVEGRHGLCPETGHTYRTWRVDGALEILWLDEATFLHLSRSQRASLVRSQVDHGRGAVPSVRRWSTLLDPVTLRAQADGHRFVWWPSLLALDPHAILARVVLACPDGSAAAASPSRHADVGRTTWDSGAAVLPEAERIAGSFAPSSGPNCFATVLAASGVVLGEHETTLDAPFLAWLGSSCRPGGRDDAPGTVLVWRDRDGSPVHAAVTLGDGWALEKASSEWWTPRAVRTVREVTRASRAVGHHLERHRINVEGPPAKAARRQPRRPGAPATGCARRRG